MSKLAWLGALRPWLVAAFSLLTRQILAAVSSAHPISSLIGLFLLGVFYTGAWLGYSLPTTRTGVVS